MSRKRRHSSSSYSYRRKRRGSSKILLFLLFFVLVVGGIAGAFYMESSPKFEKIPPKIEMTKELFYSPDASINVTFKDNYGVGKYRAILSDGVNEIEIASGDFKKLLKVANISLVIPKNSNLDKNRTNWILSVELSDKSLWNFGQGNKTVDSAKIVVDVIPPKISLIANSPSIIRGGSALVIFKVVEKNIKKCFVEVSNHKFTPIKYKKDGYFATLVAWDFKHKEFSAKVVVLDIAENMATLEIPFEPIQKKYRKSWLKISDRFIDGKISQIAQSDPVASKIKNRLKKFKFVNETMRLKNEALIHKYSKIISTVDFDKWRYLKPFEPLKKDIKVADFGDERHYYYRNRNNEVSLSYHLGYDLASVKHDSIHNSNLGIVRFSNYNGIYGRMPLVDYGFGLYALYGHCSETFFGAGDIVKSAEIIAKTGVSGLALGDHLHFGMLVQGIEVLPSNWMREDWIKRNITDVFKRADIVLKRLEKS